MAMAIRMTCSGANPTEIENQARAAAVRYFGLGRMRPVDTLERLIIHDFTATPLVVQGDGEVITWEAEVEVVLRERN